MAVFHLKASFGSRAGGQSARAKSDYIEREGRYEKDGEELEHKENENMPEWARDDPEKYWEAADEHERANGRLYSEVQFALPKELNEDERREAASRKTRKADCTTSPTLGSRSKTRAPARARAPFNRRKRLGCPGAWRRFSF